MLKPAKMALNYEIVAFSPKGDYLAFSTPDGRLKLWETATGVLQQEYTPSSHLSSTCNCLAWCPARNRSNSPRKKRKKSSEENEFSSSDIIAMGTTSGSILLYSTVEADLHTQLEKGHTSGVNAVCWSSSSDTLYSCSSDQYIVQWDVKKSAVKHKWKADRHSLFSIHLVDEDNLISASRSIKWWDLSKREVVKKFTGHATEVFRILSVRFSDAAGAEGTYFLTSAQNDRLISAWQMRKESDVNALANFAASEEIVNFDVSSKQKKNEPVLLSAVTQSGVLHVYEHQLNGKCAKPLESSVRVMLSTEGANGTRAKPIPILAACVLGGQERRVLIAYGSFLKPTFEEIIVKECKAEEWLIRQDFAASASVAVEQSVSKVKRADRSSKATVLAPGFMTPVDANQPLKRKETEEVNENQLPMEERLHALTLVEDQKRRGAPSANHLVHLLLQGLQSKNVDLIYTVLTHQEESLISNTVRRLPLTAIVPLLQELQKRMHVKALCCVPLLKWTKCVISTHTSYLMTCPEVDSLVGSMSQLMEARAETFARLSQIRGKLNLLLSQVTASEDKSLGEALLTHQESSDDENVGSIGDDMVPSFSESEDEWSDEMDADDDPNRTSSEDDDD